MHSNNADVIVQKRRYRQAVLDFYWLSDGLAVGSVHLSLQGRG